MSRPVPKRADAPIRVLYLIDTLGAGGAQMYLLDLASRLNPAQFAVEVAALAGDGPHRQALQARGITVHPLSTAPYSNAHLPAYVARLFHLLRRRPFDVVHIFLQASFAIGTPLAWLLRIPVVHYIVARRAQVPRWYYPLLGWYQHAVQAYLVGVDLDQLLAVGVREEKIKLVETTVDLTALLALQHQSEAVVEPFDLAGAFPVVVSVGRLHPDKGHAYAIRAWPHVLQEWPQARLLIVGDGADEGRLRALVAAEGLTESVLFAGYRTDLAAIFARADLYVRPSLKEGNNLATTQAMAAGLPIVGFQTEAVKDFVVHNHSGWLVPVGDILALAHAINHLSRNPALRQRLVQRARIGIQQYHDLERTVSFYEQLYIALASRQPLHHVPDMREYMWPQFNPFGNCSAS